MEVEVKKTTSIDVSLTLKEAIWLKSFVHKPIEINGFSNESDEDTTIRIELYKQLYKQLNKLKRG